MFKNMSIKKKFLYIGILILGGALVMGSSYLYMLKNQLASEVYEKSAKSLQHTVDNAIVSKKIIGITNAVSIASDESLQDGIATGDRQKVLEVLTSLSDHLKANTPLKNIKVHIHTKNNRSFLRSWKPKKFGDDLSSFRKSVVTVNTIKKPVNTFEVGKSGLSIRSVVPIVKNGNHLGSLEFMQGVNSVAKSLAKKHKYFLLLMDKKLTKSKSGKLFQNKYIISQKFINRDFLHDVSQIPLRKLLKDGMYYDHEYFYTYKNVKDFQGKVLGIYIVAERMEEVNHAVDSAEYIINMTIIAFLLSVVVLLFVFEMLLSSLVLKPLGNLKQGIIKLINNNSNDSSRLEVAHEDEVGKVVISFNDYLNSIDEGLKQDHIVIEDVNETLKMASAGIFKYTIKATSPNETINNLKDSINKLLSNVDKRLSEIDDVLISFGAGDFAKDINIKGVHGGISSVVLAMEIIKANTSELLAIISTTGDHLLRDIDVLSQSSTALSESSNQQAASLEETAAAIEELSGNIQSSAESVNKMSSLSHNISTTTTDGQALASKTADSMEEINVEVGNISESISIIDQIAFQTNILSLNAAVEAATAGEAGKGFAVVAGEVRNLASRSAEAANEIKKLVESAQAKTQEGKDITDNMIKGYNSLADKIKENQTIIDNVATSAKEQHQAIKQINDAVNILDQNTQQNALEATSIDDMAKSVDKLAKKLTNMASRAKYDLKAKERICDIDTMAHLNQLKLDHFNFKAKSLQSIVDKKSFTVVKHTECKLAKWIAEQESKGADVTKTQNWTDMKKTHQIVHSDVQEYINQNATGSSNDELLTISEKFESAVATIFKELDIAKIEHCEAIRRG